jgi:hypothetical protein
MLKHYMLLRIVGVLYRVLAFLAFLTTTGAIFFSASNTLRNVPSTADAIQKVSAVLADSLPLAAAGFILMVTFYAFAEIINLLTSLTDYVRDLVKAIQDEAKDRSKPVFPKVRD